MNTYDKKFFPYGIYVCNFSVACIDDRVMKKKIIHLSSYGYSTGGTVYSFIFIWLFN